MPSPSYERFLEGCGSPFMRLAEHLTALRACCKQYAWLVKSRRAPSRHSRDARVYSYTTTAMHTLSIPPPPPPLPPPKKSACVRLGLWRLLLPTDIARAATAAPAKTSSGSRSGVGCPHSSAKAGGVMIVCGGSPNTSYIVRAPCKEPRYRLR